MTQSKKCGDCIHWRKATAKQRRGYYFRRGMKPGRCHSLQMDVNGWVDQNRSATGCEGFNKRIVLEKNKCGDCKWWSGGIKFRTKLCQAPIAKSVSATRRYMQAGNKFECPCWRAKNVKTKGNTK